MSNILNEDDLKFDLESMEVSIKNEKLIGCSSPLWSFMKPEFQNKFYKFKFVFEKRNTKTDEERDAILNLIRNILDDNNIKYVHKLRAINSLIGNCKDCWDDFDSLRKRQ